MIYDEWCSYDACVLPETAPPEQRTECRRAFYAGAFAAMQKLYTCYVNDSPGALAGLMSRMAIECDEFKKNVLKGNR